MMAAIKLGASALPTGDVYYGVCDRKWCFLSTHSECEVWGRIMLCLYIGVFMDVWHYSSHGCHLDAFQESELFELPNIRRRARVSERLARPHFYRLPPIKQPRGDHFFCFLRISRLATRSPSPLIYIAPRRLVNQNWAMTMPTDDSIHAPVKTETPQFATAAHRILKSFTTKWSNRKILSRGIWKQLFYTLETIIEFSKK
jgi:hypothetical protein